MWGYRLDSLEERRFKKGEKKGKELFYRRVDSHPKSIGNARKQRLKKDTKDRRKRSVNSAE